MTNIYEFIDYRVFLQTYLKQQPNKGRGLLSRWAEALNVHPTLLSQIVSGKKDISLEAAEELARIIHLTEDEADFFLLLVQHSRAGSMALKKHWKRNVENAQKKYQRIGERLKDASQLDDVGAATFYSSWLYAGVRNLSATPEMNSVEDIARCLQIPRDIVLDVVNFLLDTGLCQINKGQLDAGTRRTHIPANSPLVQKHHQNWRLKSFEQMMLRREEDLFFTFPMSLSKSDAELIRQRLPAWIEEIHKIVGPSPSETVRCLNLDFFRYGTDI